MPSYIPKKTTAPELTNSAQPTSRTAVRLGLRVADCGIAWLSDSSESAVRARESDGTVASAAVGSVVLAVGDENVDMNRNAFTLA
jgi:hypothetical protein